MRLIYCQSLFLDAHAWVPIVGHFREVQRSGDILLHIRLILMRGTTTIHSIVN